MSKEINITKIQNAVNAIQNELQSYLNETTPDGPYIMIWPHKIEVIDCYGHEATIDSCDVLS